MTALDLADGLRLIQSVPVEDHFGHAEHLRFAWALLDEAEDTGEAERVAKMTIRHVAELAGNPGKYNCTMTMFWIRVLANVRQQHEGVSSLKEAMRVFPPLADPHLHDKHWSNIESEEAKRQWVEPDLAPLP